MNQDLLIRQALLDAALADFNQFAPTIIPQKNLHSTPMTCVQQTILRSTTCHMHDGSSKPEDSDFSPQYLAWENKFLRNPQAFAQRALRPVWQTALRSAACFLLVVSLSFGSLMAFSPQARAWVVSWFTQNFSTHTSYRFTEQIPADHLQLWEPAYLPEEYIDTEFIDLENQIVVYYHSDDPSMKIKFNYKLTSEGSGFSLDNEHHSISDISVGNMPGQLFQAENDSPNMLVWFDSSSHHAFMLASRLPCDTLVQIAESVAMKK